MNRESEGHVLVSANQVAGLLQISPRTIWRLVNSGKLISPIRLGHSVRWRKEELLKWVEAGCPTAEIWKLRKD